MIDSLFESNYYGSEAVQLRQQHKEHFNELVGALRPVWSKRKVAHYCYRGCAPLHVLSANSFEITINVGGSVNIPNGFDLQDSLRVKHITVDVWDSVDVQALVELLLKELDSTLILTSVNYEKIGLV